VDLRNSEQLSSAYQKINPQRTVPVLRTQEGDMLTDNAAIAVYLEARYPEPPLLGTSPNEKAHIASWNWRVEFDGLLAVAETLRNSAPSMANRALAGQVDYPHKSPTWPSAAWPGCSSSLSCSTSTWLTGTSSPPIVSAWPTSRPWWPLTLHAL